jgi:hypothetical protein
VQFGLPEPIAAALLLAGFLLVRRRWIVAGAVLFAASLLVRETGGVLVAATAAGVWLSRRRRDAVLLLVVAVVPVVAWRLYVGVTLAPQWGAQAYWFDPENLGVPFGGIADLWRTAAQGAYYPEMAGMTRAAIGLTLLLGAALVLAAAAAVARPGVLTVSAVLYAVMAVSLTYSSIWIHVGNAQRGTYEVFVVLALLSIGGRELPRALRVALAMFWVAAGAYSFFGAYDADFVRNALL